MNYFANSPDLKDKIICGLLYSAMFVPFVSWVPVIWLVVINIKKVHVKEFIRYHCYQALLFNMVIFFVPSLLTTLVKFLGTLLSLLFIFDNTINLLSSLSNWFVQIYLIAMQLAALYAIIWTMRGKYTELPPLSKAVNHILRA